MRDTKRTTKKKNRRTSSTADVHLWLVPFTFERPRTKQRGSFQMVVEAVTPDDAMDRCHQRLLELAATTALFKEPVPDLEALAARRGFEIVTTFSENVSA